MQKGAQYKAVWELLTLIFQDKYPADNIISGYMRERKYIGSKDRRFITETVWDIIRHRRRLEFDAQSTDARKILLIYLKDADFDIICNDGEYALASLTAAEKEWLKRENDSVYPAAVEAETPDWLYDKIKDTALLKSLNQTAPADLRINRGTRDSILKRLQGEGLFFSPTGYSPIGIRSSERVNLHNCMAYQEGDVEVQDEASQIAAILADVKPRHKTIDYCCGAGGKTLTISFLTQGQGQIDIHDVNAARLAAVKDRAARLGVKNIRTVLTPDGADYERFIVDAPCSGSGTWRRSPDAKFRLTPEQLNELVKTQAAILGTAYKHTKPGGRIVYFTCSVLPEENELGVEAFKARHPDMKNVNLKNLWQEKLNGRYPVTDEYYLHLNPLISGTDGFFVAILQKG